MKYKKYLCKHSKWLTIIMLSLASFFAIQGCKQQDLPVAQLVDLLKRPTGEHVVLVHERDVVALRLRDQPVALEVPERPRCRELVNLDALVLLMQVKKRLGPRTLSV